MVYALAYWFIVFYCLVYEETVPPRPGLLSFTVWFVTIGQTPSQAQASQPARQPASQPAGQLGSSEAESLGARSW